MKRIITFCLMATLCLLVASCGNRSRSGMSQKEKQIADELVGEIADGTTVGYTGNAGKDLKKLDNKNYVGIVKGIFGVDVSPMGSWNLDKAYSPNKVNNVDIIYSNNGEVDEDAIVKNLFEKCQAIAEDGLHKVDIDFSTFSMTPGKKYANYADLKAEGETSWFYKYKGQDIHTDITVFSEAKSRIEYQFLMTATK